MTLKSFKAQWIWLILLATVLLINKQALASQTDEDILNATVLFEQPLSVAQAINVMQDLAITTHALLYQYTLPNYGAFSGGYMIQPHVQTPADIEADYALAHEIFIEDVRQDIETELKTLSSNNALYGSVENALQELNAFQQVISHQGILITGVEVEGTKAQLSELQARLVVKSVQIAREMERVNPVESVTSSADWWPHTVKLTTQVSSYSGSRYARHAMWWNATDLTTLKNFGTKTTYEPDTVYNNYDDQLYLGTTIYYWSSNHSSVYLDTEAFDSGDERVLTVGFYDVQGLSADTEYYTYVRTNYGNHSSDTGKANGQRGHRLWNSCTSPWCIFGDETKFLNPSAWNHSVPGTTWGYN